MSSPIAPLSRRAASARTALSVLLLAAPVAACGDNLSPAGGDDDVGGEPDAAPQPDSGVQGVAIEGLDGPVDVYFDEQGIMHAICQSDADCFAVEGYFHAAHRFAQMDIRRRFARGKLAALVGPFGLDTDIAQRQMMMARDGTPLEEQLLAAAQPETVAALEAYSRGVNAWMDDVANERNGAVLPDEYSFFLIDQAAIFDDWEPLDSVACILPLVASLTEQSGEEILAGQIYGALDPAVAQDLFGLRPSSISTILPPPSVAGRAAPKTRSGRATAAAARRLHARMAKSRGLFAQALATRPRPSLDNGGLGSNNWVVGPTRTVDGVALLANDPHLGLSHPSVWYLAHLDAKTAGMGGSLHVAGATFAGLPGVVLGHNEDIAWGATTTVFDSTDVYKESLNGDRTAVIFTNDKEVPILQVSHEFEVAGQAPVTVDLPFVPHHGPIVAIDGKNGTALSVRWTGHDADTDINLFWRLAMAKTVEEARVALEETSTTTGQNWVVIDRDGHIGWFPYMKLPQRPWASETLPPWLPLPGDGSAEWGAPIPFEMLPQAMDPPEGFLATANNDMTGALADGDPTNDDQLAMQGFVDPGYRHQRIVELLGDRNDHDLASMQGIQSDVFSLLGALLAPMIVDFAGPIDANGQAIVDALNAWNFTCPTGLDGIAPDAPADPDTAAAARGCLAFHVTWSRLREMVFGDELAAAGVTEAAQPAALIFALTDPGALNRDYWDDVTTGVTETQADIVAAALTSAGAFLRGSGLGEPENWLWGRLHTVTLRADLFSDADIPTYDSATFANDGGRFTVDVANPRGELADDYTQSAGPSMRMVCQAEADLPVSCTIELPGGQRHYRDSRFYDSMLDNWLTNTPAPFAFSLAELTVQPGETVRVEPR